ncbi:MAG: hypothetical protein KKE59_06200, partial [Proteobacteria bacterium]|nr:hypothetical protein [Pseudomonadota bacterium]
MTCFKKMILFLFTGAFLFAHSPAAAVPPDFNADRRVNIKCPSTIDQDREGQFKPDGLMYTLKRLYHELDMNLWASARKGIENKYGEGYAFSDNTNEGIFFICHAKAYFPSGGLDSLSPKDKIQFREVFYITEIDWDKQQVNIVRQRDKKKFTINVPD